MLMLDARRDYIQTHMQMLDDEGLSRLAEAFATLQADAVAEFAKDGMSSEKLRFEWYIDARYTGQEHTVKVALGELQLPSILESFHARHEQSYTFRLDLPMEVVNLHLVAFGTVPKSPMAPIGVSNKSSAESALIGRRWVEFEPEQPLKTPLYQRSALLSGMRVDGPAIIEEATTTTVVRPGDQLEVDVYGGLHIHINVQEVQA